MKTKIFFIISILSFGLMAVFQGCGTADDTAEEVLISGEVRDASSGNVIEGAIVEITSPSSLKQTTTSDSLGLFSFTVETDSSITLSIEATKQGFQASTQNIKVAPESDVTDLIFELSSTDGGGGDDGDGGVGGESQGAASIILVDISEETINIAESGGIVNSAFTFEVQDSAGRSLSLENAVDVNFSIVSGPGGGESITPKSVRTNASGQATSNLFAGNAAGVVKIQAEVVRSDIGLTIQSKPIVITIHGGFPDLAHFSIAPQFFNFEGWDINGVRNSITVIVGDKFGNPVKPGTPVYFTTTGGIIQGSGNTDEDGIVTVDLISGDPRPNDAVTGSGGRPGYGTITAKTVDENDQEIQKEVVIVFSSKTADITINPTTINIPSDGGQSFTYTVTDINGNPMAAGTSISVQVGEGLDATGDVDFTLGDHRFPGPGSTEFEFSVTDTDQESSTTAETSLTIQVTSPSGNVSLRTISGTRADAPPIGGYNR